MGWRERQLRHLGGRTWVVMPGEDQGHGARIDELGRRELLKRAVESLQSYSSSMHVDMAHQPARLDVERVSED